MNLLNESSLDVEAIGVVYENWPRFDVGLETRAFNIDWQLLKLLINADEIGFSVAKKELINLKPKVELSKLSFANSAGRFDSVGEISAFPSSRNSTRDEFLDLKLQVSIEKDLLDVLVGSLSENKEEYKSNLETLEGLKEVFVHEFELIKENASSYSTHIRLRLQDEMVLYFNGKKASDEVLEFLEYL